MYIRACTNTYLRALHASKQWTGMLGACVCVCFVGVWCLYEKRFPKFHFTEWSGVHSYTPRAREHLQMGNNRVCVLSRRLLYCYYYYFVFLNAFGTNEKRKPDTIALAAVIRSSAAAANRYKRTYFRAPRINDTPAQCRRGPATPAVTGFLLDCDVPRNIIFSLLLFRPNYVRPPKCGTRGQQVSRISTDIIVVHWYALLYAFGNSAPRDYK